MDEADNRRRPEIHGWRGLWQFLTKPNASPGEGAAQPWREWLLGVLLLLGVTLGLVVLAVSVYTIIFEGAWGLVALDVVLYLAVVALYFLPRLPYRLRATVSCLLLFLAGMGVSIRLGPFSGGPAYLFTFCILCGVLLGLRYALVALGMNIVTVVVMIVLLGRGYFPEVLAAMPSMARWMAAGSSFVLLNLVTAVSVALLLKGLERSLAAEEEAREELEREMARRSTAEQELAEREKWYRTTFEHTGTAMLISDGEGRITLANQRLCELAGYSRDELVGMNWRRLAHPDDRDFVGSYHHQRLTGGSAPDHYEVRLVTRRGDVRHVLNNVQLIPGTSYVIASILDITDRKRYERDLAESQGRYKSLLATLPDPVVAYDRAGNVTYLNDAFLRVYGWSLEELEGRRIDFVPEGEAERTADAWSRQMHGEQMLFESKRRTKSGRVIDVEICGASITDWQGDFDGAVVIHRDITDRSASEAALKASEQKFATAFRQAPIWVVISSLEEGIFLDVNQAFLRATGFSREEVLGKTAMELGLWEDQEERDRIQREIRSRGSVRNQQVRRRTRDGLVLDMLYSGERIRYGDRDCVLSVSQDITELKRVQQRYLQSEEQFRTAFNGAPSGMALVGLDRTFLKLNQRLCEMLGYTESEMLGQDFNRFTHPDDRAGGTGRYLAFLNGEKEYEQAEKRYRHKDGSVVWVLISNSLVRDEKGDPSHVVAHVLDITQRKKAEQALVESERRFRLAFQTSPDAIAINCMDDGAYVSLNQGFTDLTGYTAEEVLGRTAPDLNIWADLDHRKRLVAELKEHGMVRNMEARFRFKDGTVHTGLMSAAVISLEGVPHIISITRDVEDWKQAELALRESENRARATLEASPDPVVVYDDVGRTTYFNPAFTRVFGWYLPELEGKRVPFVPESEKALTARMVAKCLAEDDPVSFTSRRLTKDGRLLDVVLSAARTVDASGRVSGMVVNLTDITERRDMERALADSEKRYRDLVDNITDFIYTHDMQGRFTSINRAASRTLGYRPEELIGHPITEIMPAEHHKAFKDEYMPDLHKWGTSSGLSIYLDRQGGKHYLEYRSDLVRDKDQATYVRGSAREVTDRIMAEREQRRLEEQLFQAQKMEALGTLTGGVAHDFNNILSAIMGSLDLAGRKLEPDHAVQRHLANAAAAANRAARVTRQLLTTARRAERQVQPVRLDTLIEDTVSLLSETIDRRINLLVELEPGIHWVVGDEAQISQVIMNLTVNARDAVLQAMAGHGGAGREHHIKVAARNQSVKEDEKRSSALAYPGEFVEIEVSDTGCGMDTDTLERIYEPFFTTKPAAEGTGLGLATVYGIVDQHRGWLETVSEPGRGASFKVMLPAASEEGRAPAERREQPAPSGEGCILVVDDERQILEIAREALTSLGYRTITAEDGEEAMSRYLEHRGEIQLILLDMTMPKLSGQEVARRVLEMDPDVGIIISSGNVMNEDTPMDQRLASRVTFLHKPYNLTDLAMTVRNLLDERQGDDSGETTP